MSEDEPWNPGDVILFRGVGQMGIWYALPVLVVRDTPELVALYWPAGTQGKWRMKPSGAKVTPQDVFSAPMELLDRIWTSTDVLMLITPGAAHAVYLMREAGWKNHLCWYINLQDPIRRTPIGFDTLDHMLDVVFSPDRSSWRWKDEEQLEDAVALGLITPAQAAQIRQEGERVIRRIQENQPPFCDGWEQWTPPAGWGAPQLQPGWDTLY
jgi:hypothetical protein